MQAMPSSWHTSRQVPLPVIGSKHDVWPEKEEQVFDEIAAAIARIAAVAVFAGAVEVVQARQVAARGWR